MSNSYLVNCPHFGCDWTGRLPAQHEAEAWRGSESSASPVVFECPGCRQEWSARVLGSVVEPLPLFERDLVVWPPMDIGVGD
jgi:hypothetical protein